MLSLRTIAAPLRKQGVGAVTAQINLDRWSFHSTSRRTITTTKQAVDVEELLKTPTWSVEALLPSAKQHVESPSISPDQLRHLLRLSALPPPKSAEDEAKMLETLSSQLHFVNDIRKVDTTGVAPLRSLRDETCVGDKEAEIGLADLKAVFDQEELRGNYYKRIRRKRDGPVDEKGEDQWDVLGAATKKVGRYFVVDGGKEG
ncbi:hypothetical protein MBLNU459_g6397t1 [Dothideomycetes sp. NU459]